MSTKVTDLTALATTDDADVLHIIDVGDDTGGGAGTSKKITVSNLLASAGSVDSVNGQTGTVVLDVDDLDDVDASNPSNNDVLKWTAGVTNKWQPVDWLSVLYTEFKLGGSTSIGNGGLTNSNLNLTSTQAKLKSGITGIEITETSPGDIDLIVATDATGSTAYTALNIDGSTTANEADINVHGKFYIHDVANTTKAYIRLNSAGNVNLSLPTSSGTLALTSAIPSVPVDSVNGQTGVVVLDTDDIAEGTTNEYFTDARVAANSAVAANTAKVGITTQQASDITANNAKIATVADDTSPQLGGNLDVQARQIDTSTTNGNIIVAPNGTGVFEVKGDTNDGAIQLNCNQNSHGVKIQSPPHSAAASYTLVLPDDTGTNGQVMTTDGSGNLSFTTVSGGGGGVTAVTGTAPIVSSGGNTPAISINTATTSVKGAMSAPDKIILNTIAGAFVSDDAGGVKNVAFESTGGISASAGVIVSMLQDTTADNTNANSKDFLGVVTSTSDTCVINGLVEITGQIPNGATAGRPLWLGTSGTFISAAPTATNAYARVVGHYVGPISQGTYGVFFNPSNDWIQIS
jgi:hypothetical protein